MSTTGAPGPVTVHCLQMAPDIDDPAGNLERITTAIRASVAAGADIVVTPELATSGYVFEDRREARARAIRCDDPVIGDWAASVGSGVAVVGFCELGTDGSLYNSAAVVTGSGLVAVHRKTHLWDREGDVFAPGDEPPLLVDLPLGRLGVLVCYELEFPELVRSLAMAGADLVVVPTNWPLLARPAGERPPEVVIAQAGARTNRVAIACADRTGTERGQEWTEGTVIIDPDGWVVATPADGVARASLDLGAARDKQLGPRNDVLADRRPGLYDRGVVQRSPESPAGLGHRAAPVVLVPGMLGDADTWRDVAGRLVAAGHAVRHARIDLDDSVAEMAASILASLPPRFVLVGHSLGGIVALEVARQAHDRVVALGLCNTTALGPTSDQMEAWAAMRRRVETEPWPSLVADVVPGHLPPSRRDDEALVARLAAMADSVGPDGLCRQLAAQASRPDSRSSLPDLGMPALVVSADRDRVCPVGRQEELAAGLPRAVHLTVADAGHMAPMEQPDAVSDHLMGWLQECGVAGARSGPARIS